MTTTACPAKITTFFQLLEQTPDLDMRDNRGKRHSLALVLTGLVAALCCGRDGNLSRLHRHMTNQFENLLDATELTEHKVISRAQLPILLAKVNGSCFAKLLFEWFGLTLDEDQKYCGAARAVCCGWKRVTGKYSIWRHTRRGMRFSGSSSKSADSWPNLLLWYKRK